MLIREYKEKIEKLEFELEQKDKTIDDLQNHTKYLENNFIPKSKIFNTIRRLEYQQENEYCDFAIMILNMIVGG